MQDEVEFDPSKDEYLSLQRQADIFASINKDVEGAKDWPGQVADAIRTGEEKIRRTAEVFAPYLGENYEVYLSQKLADYHTEVERIGQSIFGNDWFLYAKTFEENGETYSLGEDRELSPSEVMDSVVKDILDETEIPNQLLQKREEEFKKMVKEDPIKALENVDAFAHEWYAEEMLKEIGEDNPVALLEHVSLFADQDYAEDVLYPVVVKYPVLAVQTLPENLIESFTLSIVIYLFSSDRSYTSDEKKEVLQKCVAYNPEVVAGEFSHYKKELWAKEVITEALSGVYNLWERIGEFAKDIKSFGDDYYKVLIELAERNPNGAIEHYESYKKHFPYYAELVVREAARKDPEQAFRHIRSISDIKVRRVTVEEALNACRFGDFNDSDAPFNYIKNYIDEPYGEELFRSYAESNYRKVIERSYLRSSYSWYNEVLDGALEKCAEIEPSFLLEQIKKSDKDYSRLLKDKSQFLSLIEKFPERFGEKALLYYARYSGGNMVYYEILKKDPLLKNINDVKLSWFSDDLKFGEKCLFAIYVCRNLTFQDKPVSEENVKTEYAQLLNERRKLADTPLFEARNVICASHEEEYPINPPSDIGTAEKRQEWSERYGGKDRFGVQATIDGIKRQQGNHSLVFEHYEPREKTMEALQAAKNGALNAIINTPSPLTFVFDGHGSKEAIYFSDGELQGDDPYRSQGVLETERTCKITAIEFANALYNRAQNNPKANLEKDIFIFDQCYSQTFVRKVIDALRLQVDKGTLHIPMFITSTEHDITGTTDVESEYMSDFFGKVLKVGSGKSTFKNIWENDTEDNDKATIITPRMGGAVMQLSQNENLDIGDLPDSMAA